MIEVFTQEGAVSGKNVLAFGWTEPFSKPRLRFGFGSGYAWPRGCYDEKMRGLCVCSGLQTSYTEPEAEAVDS